MHTFVVFVYNIFTAENNVINNLNSIVLYSFVNQIVIFDVDTIQ